MKTLLLLSLSFLSLHSQAAETTVLRTRVGCTVKGQAVLQVLNEGEGTSVVVGDYTFTPARNGDSKQVTITRTGQAEAAGVIDLGTGTSTSTYLELPAEDGSLQKCSILMEINKAE